MWTRDYDCHDIEEIKKDIKQYEKCYTFNCPYFNCCKNGDPNLKGSDFNFMGYKNKNICKDYLQLNKHKKIEAILK